MAELSEKELLLLSNYMYMDVSVKKVNIGDMLTSMQNAEGEIDPSLLPEASGGMTREDVGVLFREMNQTSDEFKSLTVTKVVNQPELRGACFEGADGEATVVFRGTGGAYEAWTDNLMGGIQADTKIQKQATAFISEECGSYNNLTVTGHSKGGNLAQYVTVKCGSQIDRCVSYDGQGQSAHFIRTHLDKIKEAQPKIKSISAHNDFVNILLTSIAGRRTFVENHGDGIEAHKSIRLLTDNEFDQDTGAFLTTCSQDTEMKLLQGFLANGVTKLDELPYGIRDSVYRTLAGIAADVLASDRSGTYKLANTTYQMTRLQQAIGTPESEGFEVNLNTLAGAKLELETGERKLSEVRDIIEGIGGVEGVLFHTLAKQVEQEHSGMKKLNQAAEMILKQYREGENAVISYCLTE